MWPELTWSSIFSFYFSLLSSPRDPPSWQVPLTETSQQFSSSSNSKAVLISTNTDRYVKTLLEKWGSAGLSVAAVRKDGTAPNGWRHEFGSYGVADADGSPMTPDSVFAIASDSKLFLAISVGLLVSNKTLAEEREFDQMAPARLPHILRRQIFLENPPFRLI